MSETQRKKWRIYKKKYYYQNREKLLQIQELYRYPKSVQKKVDDAWSKLVNYDDIRLKYWAVENEMLTNPTRWKAFLNAVERNRQETIEQINDRRKEMKLFQKNIKRRK